MRALNDGRFHEAEVKLLGDGDGLEVDKHITPTSGLSTSNKKLSEGRFSPT